MNEDQKPERQEAGSTTPSRGREVNRRIATGDLQRMRAQLRLVQRVYGVGALSTAILTGVLLASIGQPGIELAALIAGVCLLCALVSVQALGALQLPLAPRAWSLGLAGLQSACYLIWLLVAKSSMTQLFWVILFLLALGPMARVEQAKSKYPDLYHGLLLGGKQTEVGQPSGARARSRLLVILGLTYGLALAFGLFIYFS